MRWPWQRLEKRDSGFTDVLVDLLQQRAGGKGATAIATGALEAAAGVVARAFASARVDGPAVFVDALTPSLLALIGRALIRRGEVVLSIEVDGGEVALLPCADYDVTGDPHPDTWRYRVNLSGPSLLLARSNVSGAGLLHFMHSRNPESPWRGIGPIQSAALAGRLSAETAAALGDESSGPRGSLLPLPVPGNSPSVATLKADIAKLSGALATVESTADSWKSADAKDSPRGDWETKRLGAAPGAPLVDLHAQASREVLSACGISPALFDPRAAAAAREAYRQLLHSTIAPLGRVVQAELRAKLSPEITLQWDELRAGDIMSKSRAYQSLVGAGMDASKAERLAGLSEASG